MTTREFNDFQNLVIVSLQGIGVTHKDVEQAVNDAVEIEYEGKVEQELDHTDD